MDKSAVFLDGGYLSKLTKSIFPYEELRGYYYQCPPYQSSFPNQEEKSRKMSYDAFTYNSRKTKQLQLREGRLIRTFDESGKYFFIQNIQKTIIVASDSDFIPAVRALKEE